MGRSRCLYRLATAFIAAAAMPVWAQGHGTSGSAPNAGSGSPDRTERQQALTVAAQSLRARIVAHNAACSSVPSDNAAQVQTCTHEQQSLDQAIAAFQREKAAFDREAAAPAPALPTDPEARKVDLGLEALAERRHWDEAKKRQLAAALTSLPLADTFTRPHLYVADVWAAVRDRGNDPVLAQEAAQAPGPGLFAATAGRQMDGTDCTIFALANATSRPYGVVAVMANDLVSDADWRPIAQRAHTQDTIENGGGLNGGEVVFLAESLGQTHVVEPKDFAETLRAGEPLLIDVKAGGGHEHEVVLSKAFDHEGATWFEMIDSYQGPLQRRFISAPELNTVIAENAVAFNPDPGTTPRLLR